MTSNRPPAVSVIIPVYNSAQWIQATLDSVFAQTYRDFEVIVVDDGSTDDTRAVVLTARRPIRYVHQSNQGPAAARNAGIEAARGELVAFLDADDLWLPDRLALQVALMARHPAVGLVFADAEEFDESGVQCGSLLSKRRYHAELLAGLPIENSFETLLVENFIPTSTVLVKRSCFEMVGVFDPALRVSEDRDMWSRIAGHFPIVCLPRVQSRKRVVAGSASRDVETTLRSRIRLWTKARRMFPERAPVKVVNALLAAAYLQLGFVLLEKNKTSEARQFGLQSIRVSRRPSEWMMACSLVTFTFTGRDFANLVFRAKRRYF